MAVNGQEEDFWLFGYGSLIWKPPPHFDIRLPGYIEGYVRRFWQVSTRCPPGRVVTLIDLEHWRTLTDHHVSAPERVWGAAYHIPPEHVSEVRDYLDIREINGYSIQYTPFHRSDLTHETLNCLVYIGLPSNPQFLGPQDPDALARHILKSKGPSGENKEYLYMLEEALEGLSSESGDEHISDLARRCKALETKGYAGPGHADGDQPSHSEHLHKVGSTEEQEEVEKV
ncbi:ChaC-domain-containing protein [Rhizodiscina lignyota]|uniref:glutathione-specific gamma-glutamylcyclotransferase n=1 Tax=Rhizodiscina lignyota TaxID=1504668 RepID=A0A9P4M4J0_9PEZI|nr:ChaC-domain-containing protein [Rhizodiscina lignyota]